MHFGSRMGSITFSCLFQTQTQTPTLEHSVTEKLVAPEELGTGATVCDPQKRAALFTPYCLAEMYLGENFEFCIPVLSTGSKYINEPKRAGYEHARARGEGVEAGSLLVWIASYGLQFCWDRSCPSSWSFVGNFLSDCVRLHWLCTHLPLRWCTRNWFFKSSCADGRSRMSILRQSWIRWHAWCVIPSQLTFASTSLKYELTGERMLSSITKGSAPRSMKKKHIPTAQMSTLSFHAPAGYSGALYVWVLRCVSMWLSPRRLALLKSPSLTSFPQRLIKMFSGFKSLCTIRLPWR